MAAFTPEVWQQRRIFTEKDIFEHLNAMFAECPATGALPVVVVSEGTEGSLQNTVYQCLSNTLLSNAVADYYRRQGWTRVDIDFIKSHDTRMQQHYWQITLYKEPVLPRQ